MGIRGAFGSSMVSASREAGVLNDKLSGLCINVW